MRPIVLEKSKFALNQLADLLGYSEPQQIKGKYYESVSKTEENERIAFFKIDRDVAQKKNLNLIDRQQYQDHIERQKANKCSALFYVVYAEENGFQLIIPQSIAGDYFTQNKNLDGQWSITMATDKALKDLIYKGALHRNLNEIFDNGLNCIQIEQVLNLLPLDSILKKAINHRDSRIIVRETKYYERNEAIKLVAKMLANGECQLCEQPAPFVDQKGIPFLESHHIIWLSNNGPDTLENSIALCPNCHSKMHILGLEKDVVKLKNRAKQLFNELFVKYQLTENIE